MTTEEVTESADSVDAALDTTEADTDSQPTNDVTDQASDTDQTATDDSMRLAYEKATGKKWKDEEGQPEDVEDEQPDKAKAEAEKGQPVAVELSDKAKKQVADLGIAEDDALKEAIRAFERHRFDEDEIERRLGKGEKKFIEDGLALAKQQKDVDSLYGRVGQLEKTPSASTKKEDAGESNKASKEPLPIPDDVKAEIDKILEPLSSDELFKDYVPVLGMMATTLSNHYEAKSQQQKAEIDTIRDQFQQELQTLGYLKVDTAIEKARAELTADKFPQLKDKTAHEKVLNMYDTFAASGRYNEKTPEQVYQEAAETVLSKDKATSYAEALAKRHLDRKKAQPSLPTNKAQSVASMSEDQKQRMVYDKIQRDRRRGT